MSAPFVGICTALYDYQAQNDEELTINENDILYLLQKSDFDDWWLVKKRVLDANAEEPQGLVPKTYIADAAPVARATALYDYTKQTEEELSFSEGTVLNVYDTSDPNWALVDINRQQFGFVPGNYIQLDSGTAQQPSLQQPAAANPVSNVMGLTPFPEPVVSPANITPLSQSFPPPPQRAARPSSSNATPPAQSSTRSQFPSSRDDDYDDVDDADEARPPMPTRPNTTTNNNNSNSASSQRRSNTYNDYSEDDNDYGDGDSDDNGHAKESKTKSFFSSSSSKSRSRSGTETSKMSRKKSISNFLSSHKDDDDAQPVHGDFAWKIHEIDGKKKRSGVLEIGNGNVYLDVDNKLSESWPITNLTNYNAEKKHIFLDFKSPSYSFELHVSNKSSAQAIMSILGDMKGLQSQSALADIKRAQREGAEAGAVSTLKKGVILYDFDGAADDELSCYEGDTVLIVNDKKNKEWWMVENSRGKRGVVPSNYVKLVSNKSKSGSGNGSAGASSSSKDGGASGFLKNLLGPNSKSPKKKGSKDRDREERELREMAKLQHERGELQKQRRRMEQKEKELSYRDRDQREKREKIRRADERLRERRLRESSKSSSANSEKDSSKPNTHRVRTWIDRSGAFKVEAEFLGVQQGKIHLHKTNGVKIAVAASKLSIEDLEYVERLTGTSLDKYKPEISKPAEPTSASNNDSNTANTASTPSLPSRESSSAVARQRTSSVPLRADLVDYWFNFFVEANVDVNVCDRYARNFAQEQVDNTVLDGVTPALMRTLGVREGDILKIKKKIDQALGRATTPDPVLGKNPTDPLPNTPATSGMSDDDWATKPAARSTTEPVKPITSPNASKSLTPQITGSIKDLLDVKPMEPTRTGITPVKPINTIGLASSNSATATGGNATGPLTGSATGNLNLQKTGAGMAPAFTGAMPMMAMPTGFMPITMVPMMTGMATGMGPLRTGGLTTGLTGGLNSAFTGGLNPAFTGGMPMTTFGVNSLAQQPQQQKTGGAYIMPLTTGSAMPATSFGNYPSMNSQATGGMVRLQPTGVRLQKTGGGLSSMPAMQPTMKTGGGFVPQSSFGIQLSNAMTGGGMMNPAMTGGFPQTSFGNPAMTGGLPQSSFGNPMMNPAITGGLPQNSFGNPMMNPAFTGGLQQAQYGNGMMTGGLPPNSFGNGMMNPALTGAMGGNGLPQTSFGNNNGMMNPALTGGLPPTSFGNGMMNPAYTGGLPPTSFGGAPNNGSQPVLQSQPTGFGFGNSIVPASTGKQANLANATADNPFGF
ncbi:hypothetical protein PICMEDRAFT_17656 [Pichia membranifaciens NRRL Y-2026]|uniref:Actin cytoskeleton-regulatory complex protein SLA1 n=1 Tax=Pichia membranifaciens NRRL Y-2026 TaxID=763406 RepID=A0A1E3NGF4_9ASCO|nr:hypothetical protein PICMEDRAFT_17656 [Pichia membranifaciens NRRL Y-2026]ODQ45166.1 hypothetical protein PICMEDRAFT_17656 [Pichia membranifaciens NRRL Y-2026]